MTIKKYTGKDADVFLEKRKIIAEIKGGKNDAEKTKANSEIRTINRLMEFLEGFSGKTRKETKVH